VASAVTAAALKSEEQTAKQGSLGGLEQIGHRMPLYEFKCPACGRIEERLQSGFEPVTPRCECGPWMILQLTPSAVVFKGKGWAKRDRDLKGRGGQNSKR
jgi:putative FmdB family regulatory protein